MKKFTSYSFLLLLTLSSFWAVGGTPFYSQDFSGGIPASWKNIDSASSGAYWRYTLVGSYESNPYGIDSFLLSPTQANGYAILDGDSLGGNGKAPQNAYLTTAVINCTGKTHVHLAFDENYAHYSDDSGIVFISTDNINWTPVYHAEAGMTNFNDHSTNPHLVDIDVSALVDNHATVYISFNYRGNWDWFWMVDDIQLYELPTADGGVTAIDTPMTSCNLAFTTNISVTIKNFGADTLSGFPLAYSINGGSPVADVCNTKIAPGDTLVFTFAVPGALMPGLNTIKAYTSIASDINTTNDTSIVIIYNGPRAAIYNLVYTNGFETLADMYGWKAWDGNNSGGTWTVATIQPHTGSRYANLNEANGDDWFFSPCIAMEQTPIDSVYKLDFYYRTFSPADEAGMEVKLFASQDTTFPIMTIVPETTVVYTTNAYSQSSTLFPLTAPTGIYYLGFHGKGVSGFNTSLEIDDIDLRLVKSVGMNQIATKSNEVVLYPNPNTGMFYLTNLKSFNGSVQVNVFDMMGKAVYNQTVNEDKIAIDLASQPAGVYMVRLSSETNVVTKMVTITR